MRDASPRETAGRSVALDANILGRDYRVACKEGERAELGEAVAFLDRRMREIRDQGKVSGADRIAVMAALNITHELLRDRAQHAQSHADSTLAGAGAAGSGSDGAAIDAKSAQRRIQDMGTAIDRLLAGQEKLF